MNSPSFINKSIPVENQIIPTTISSPISKRISIDLFNQFSNLNFAGVYRIGSESVRDECYIGSNYNMTYKITHHLNLLYRGEHHSKGLQDWVNTNGIESLDISILARCKPNPDEFEDMEQYFLDLYKPKFNSILNKKAIKVEIKEIKDVNCAREDKALNGFGQPIINKFGINCIRHRIIITSKSQINEERKTWMPTVVICNEGEEIKMYRGDFTNLRIKKKVVVKETVVVRKNIFNAR